MNNLNDIILSEGKNFNTLAKQLAAVKLAGWNIQYIRNPSEEVQIAAVSQDGSAIKSILEHGIIPSIAVQRAAVLQDPTDALYYMIIHNFVKFFFIIIAHLHMNCG